MAIAKDAKNTAGGQQGKFKVKTQITGQVNAPDVQSVLKNPQGGASCAGAHNSKGSRPAGQRAAG